MDPQEFLAHHNIDSDKAMQFQLLLPEQQQAVMAKGSLSTARDPNAVLVQRMNDVKGGGKGSLDPTQGSFGPAQGMKGGMANGPYGGSMGKGGCMDNGGMGNGGCMGNAGMGAPNQMEMMMNMMQMMNTMMGMMANLPNQPNQQF